MGGLIIVSLDRPEYLRCTILYLKTLLAIVQATVLLPRLCGVLCMLIRLMTADSVYAMLLQTYKRGSYLGMKTTCATCL